MNKIRLISTIIFLLVGFILGIIALKINGWSFAKFISNPTVDLIILVLLIVLILWWSGGGSFGRRK